MLNSSCRQQPVQVVLSLGFRITRVEAVVGKVRNLKTLRRAEVHSERLTRQCNVWPPSPGVRVYRDMQFQLVLTRIVEASGRATWFVIK
jgi:hypothetical protein